MNNLCKWRSRRMVLSELQPAPYLEELALQTIKLSVYVWYYTIVDMNEWQTSSKCFASYTSLWQLREAKCSRKSFDGLLLNIPNSPSHETIDLV